MIGDFGARLFQMSSSYSTEAFATRGSERETIVGGFQVADKEVVRLMCRLRSQLCVFKPSLYRKMHFSCIVLDDAYILYASQSFKK